jgi:hypothetical protein
MSGSGSMTGQRPIAVGPLRITELATMVTDFAIAAICVAFAIGVERSATGVATARGVWAVTFALTAVAATIGGVVHGFALHLRPTTKQRLWKATQYTMGVTSFTILVGAVFAFLRGPAQTVLLAVALIKLVLYLAIVPGRDDYTIVVTDYALSMLGAVTLATVGWMEYGAPAAPWLVSGVVVSAIAAAIQLTKVAPHPRFNHNDLYHVVQIVALYLFYRGGLLLVDR